MQRGSHFYRNCLAIRFSVPYSVLIMKAVISSSSNFEYIYRTRLIYICYLRYYYAAQNGSFLLAFQNNWSASSSEVKQPKNGPTSCLEMSVRSYHSTLQKLKRQQLSLIWRQKPAVTLHYIPLNQVFHRVLPKELHVWRKCAPWIAYCTARTWNNFFSTRLQLSPAHSC
jgi:hypothetical protein